MENLLRTLCFFCLLLLPYPSSSFPLCTNLRQPSSKTGVLSFCPYNGKVCCSRAEDLQLQKKFMAMNISDSSCASAVKSILCATCDPFSAKLFNVVDSEPRSVPILCNSTAGIAASSSSSLWSQKNDSFCSTVWESCQDVEILNSPFAPALQSKAEVQRNATPSKLTDLWQSESDFCNAFGGNSLCFNGEPVSLNKTDALPPPKGMCLEKIGNGSYINMVAHPDGSNRAFFSSLAGKIWLATIPEQDSGEVLGVDESSPFVDLTDQVYLDTSFGMMGMAFHPNFATNGRFFASFNCDKVKSPGCSGRCACNSDVGCDPSQLGSLDSGEVCKYHIVIAEYTANGTASTPSMAEKARPREVQRIFTLGLPFTANHGGQILFSPADGYLYIMMGDGGSKGDPYNFAQNKKSLLGKIMRVDVDNFPSEEDIAKLDLWGNYSVPRDNPYSEDKEMQPEIWAYGLRNPWRCSFDSERPSYFLCADVGQDQYEEVDIISKGGNYGWRVYEGPLVFETQKTPGGNTSADSIDPIFPVLGYSHSNINKLGSAAISGGYFCRSQTDPCTYGSYLYGDLYANHIWAASETPQNSGNFTTSDTPFSCAPDSPIKCDLVPNSNLPALEYIFSFGQDNRRDVYILTQSGVYRIVRPSRCNYVCSKEVATSRNPPAAAPSHGYLVRPHSVLVLFVSAFLLSLELFL
ncbi:catalytics protein [Perilla frutescens var. hirtella]|uniref:Catalytics protein n=1 Tax=Perilla frutescens var. hirtella TaxID=608512 RepID=A0AAD4IPC7_PERFH|nr:catalytics protein [Perilla frutescens var. hirtella]